MRVKYEGGARQGYASLYRHHNLYQNIEGLSGMCEHAQATKLRLRIMGARRGCASMHKTTNDV